MDFTIVSMRISSFVMVCGRVLQEVGLFLMLGVRLHLEVIPQGTCGCGTGGVGGKMKSLEI